MPANLLGMGGMGGPCRLCLQQVQCVSYTASAMHQLHSECNASATQRVQCVSYAASAMQQLHHNAYEGSAVAKHTRAVQ